MMAAIERMISQQLGPVIDRLIAMEIELEDLRRRADGYIRIGTVTEVDHVAGTARVSHGDLLTPAIRYFNPSAGEQSETRHPSVGEQCLLLNYGGGESSKQSIALTGVPSGAFPIVSTEPNITRRVQKDGTASAYDHDAHAFTWANGPLSIRADQSGVEVLLGGVGFRMSAAGFEHIGGAVTHDGVPIDKTHGHLDVSIGDDVSGPPEPA